MGRSALWLTSVGPGCRYEQMEGQEKRKRGVTMMEVRGLGRRMLIPWGVLVLWEDSIFL